MEEENYLETIGNKNKQQLYNYLIENKLIYETLKCQHCF